MRKVELFPTRDCEAGYAPGFYVVNFIFIGLNAIFKNMSPNANFKAFKILLLLVKRDLEY